MIDEKDLRDRTFRFACDITKLCARLHDRGPIVKHLSFQLLDAGTSIGANFEEGQAGQTKPFLRESNEFIAMLTASLKTARSSSSRG